MEAAKHPGCTVMHRWSEDKLKLMDLSKVTHRYFVRIKGSLTRDIDQVEAVFGQVRPAGVPDLSQEFCFVTEPMTEEEYKEKAGRFDTILNRIRVR